ncbi:MAG: rhodanese-like domain-containing protein [Magnetococcales bacterium]|nr:rhodanese-like domain-containing protein [Magnetococcales bacterium]
MKTFGIPFSYLLIGLLLFFALPESGVASDNLPVKITREIPSFQVKHGDRMVTVMRNQDTLATIHPTFAKTSRKCPPFCAQPMQAAPGVETIGEIELIHFMMTKLQDGRGVLVDARTPDWHMRGTIPGSINIPYISLSPSMGADDISIEDALNQLGVKSHDDQRDFSQAKTVALWCNGSWCGQSPTAIRGLLELGYPAKKILYYRGGMQSWHSFGLTVVTP